MRDHTKEAIGFWLCAVLVTVILIPLTPLWVGLLVAYSIQNARSHGWTPMDR